MPVYMKYLTSIKDIFLSLGEEETLIIMKNIISFEI